jgi:DNA-binding NarL/FixJ family response regulator
MAFAHRVLLVDDHPVMRMGLRLVLEPSGKFTVCGEASTVAEGRQLAEQLRPDFVVLDLLLGGRDGLELVSDILAAHPAAYILIYSSQDELRYARRALQAGARGYVSKAAGLPEVLTALEALSRGELHVSAAVQRALVQEAARGSAGTAAANPLDHLSNRELQVFRLLGSGLGTEAVADELRLSVKTVGTYRERLKDKLGLENARELERCAENYVRTGAFAAATTRA